MNDLNTNTDYLVLQLVGFNLANGEFGEDILKAQETSRMLDVTARPNSSECVEGAVNLRGRIIPVIDLRTRLSLSKIDDDGNTRVIVVNLNGRTVGLVVDEVREVLRIPASVTDPAPDMVGFVVDEVSEVSRISASVTEPTHEMVVSGIDSSYIIAVAKLEERLLLLLNLNIVISS